MNKGILSISQVIALVDMTDYLSTFSTLNRIILAKDHIDFTNGFMVARLNRDLSDILDFKTREQYQISSLDLRKWCELAEKNEDEWLDEESIRNLVYPAAPYPRLDKKFKDNARESFDTIAVNPVFMEVCQVLDHPEIPLQWRGAGTYEVDGCVVAAEYHAKSERGTYVVMGCRVDEGDIQ